MKHDRIETESERREREAREARAQVSLTCEIRQGTRPWKRTRLEDISRTGFRMAWFPNCSRDMPIKIRIPGLQLLTADVRWQGESGFGCEFVEPLHIAVFEHIARTASQG
ncbi:MAG: PilZ domain-containing protein [Sphingomonadaceae bacterium]|jgi:hypothetical protein